MRLVRGAWKLLVGIKDGLVLIAMLIFFGLIFAALSARPNATIRDGAPPLSRSVWHGEVVDPTGGAASAGAGAQRFPAVTIAVTKKPGANAIDVHGARVRAPRVGNQR